jgi:endonuclease YncB( thermonuclease family)
VTAFVAYRSMLTVMKTQALLRTPTSFTWLSGKVKAGTKHLLTSGSVGGACALAICVLAAACTPAASHTTDLTGRVSVVDGDTLEMRGDRIRLWGVDAFETRQLCDRPGGTYRCGQVAANALDARLAGQIVTCEPVGRPDRYGRTVARCQVRSQDLGAWLVENGHALDYPRYSRGRYAREQQRAQAAERGAWAGQFEPPWEWRSR